MDLFVMSDIIGVHQIFFESSFLTPLSGMVRCCTKMTNKDIVTDEKMFHVWELL
jgi:hypothetical protein